MADDVEQILRPVRLPLVLERLRKHWLEDKLTRQVLMHLGDATCYMPGADVGRPEEFAALVKPATVGEQQIDAFCRRVGNGLYDAELYWISSQFTDLAADAAQDLPDVTIEPNQLPSASGLVVWQHSPWQNMADGGQSDGQGTPVHAASWFSTPKGVWVTLYVVPELAANVAGPDLSRQTIREKIGFLLPHAPGGGAPFGARADQPVTSDMMRILFATWFLILQPGVADDSPGPVDRGVQRRYARAGHRFPAVHVVNLRRRPVPEGREAPEKGRTYGVRWIVRGHWRDQPYGQGRALRRRIYIAPYLKGPDEAPVKAPVPTVKKLA